MTPALELTRTLKPWFPCLENQKSINKKGFADAYYPILLSPCPLLFKVAGEPRITEAIKNKTQTSTKPYSPLIL